MIDLHKTTLSYSGIKALLHSPDHFIQYKTVRSEPTAAMRFGSAFDRFLLEGVPPLILPEGINLRTNEGKAQNEKIEAEAAAQHREVVTIEDMKKMQDMKASVLEHPVAKELMALPGKAQAEEFLEYTPVKGKAPVMLHVKRDWYCDETEDPVIVDLKTCKSADQEEISRAIANLKYYIQAMIYMMPDMARGLLPEFRFLFVETEAPYGVQVVALDVPWMMKAQEDIEAACKTFVAWRDGQLWWTGYSDRTVTLSMPGYLANKKGNMGGTICPANMKVQPPKPAEQGAVVTQPNNERPIAEQSKATEPVPPVPAPQTTAPAETPQESEKKRKERSDKGKPRTKITDDAPKMPEAHDETPPPPSVPSATAENAPQGKRGDEAIVGNGFLDKSSVHRVAIWDGLLDRGAKIWANDYALREDVIKAEHLCQKPFMRWRDADIAWFEQTMGVPS